MALTPTQAWKDAAAAGTAEAVMLFEFKPTALYSEKCNRDDWAGGSSLSNLDVAHSTDELRLAASTDIEHYSKQGRYAALTGSGYTFLFDANNSDSNITAGAESYEQIGQFVQTFKTAEAVRLLKLKIGLFNSLDGNHNSYKGKTIVRLFSHVNSKANITFSKNYVDPLKAHGLYENARMIVQAEIDHSLDSSDGVNKPVKGTDYDSDSSGNYWRILDFSNESVYLPGGNILCAIDLYANTATGAEHLQLRGSNTDAYTGGQFLTVDRPTKSALTLTGDLGFAFVVQGYAQSGSGIYSFDLGEVPATTQTGELEMKYWEPAGTTVKFECRESANNSTWTSWRVVHDSSKLTGLRYVQVRVTLAADTNRIFTPRVYSIRVAYKRSDKFMLASGPMYGYPAIVSDAPDYSAEGDPLEGTARATDTSQFSLLDGGGMASRLFDLYNLKNDQVNISLGFNATGFLETDFLALKTLWIEDWEIDSNLVTVHCYDQQVRLKEAEAPTAADPPVDTEQIHFAGRTPGQIKTDLLALARIRCSSIDVNTNLAALNTAFPWSLYHVIEEPTSLEKVDRNLNKHLLAFMTITESGKWVCRYVNFTATPAATLSGDDILVNSEKFYPGRRSLKNYVSVFYGQRESSTDEKSFEGVAVDYDATSEKANKEFAVDKLLSEFIPLDTDGGAATGVPRIVAHNRLKMQRHGVRVIEFSTRLQYAYLQIGDHISLTSLYYSRAGASSPNPLLVMLTRKEIDATLKAVHWSGLVVLDADESNSTPDVVEPPTAFTATANGTGGLTWAWTASADDDGTYVDRYELFQRLGNATAWGAAKATVSATGAGSYSYADTAFKELCEYDFAVQAVHVNGKRSAMATVENRLLTNTTPSTPSGGYLKITAVAGGFYIYVSTDTAGARYYNLYASYDANGYKFIGRIDAGGLQKNRIFWTLPDSTTVKAGGLIGFRYTVVDLFGQEGSPCSPAPVARWTPEVANSAQTSTADTPTAPAFNADGGTYPQIVHISTGPYFGIAVRLVIVPVVGEEDDIDHYDLERRDDGGTSKVTWGAWGALPEYKVIQSFIGQAAAKSILYENRDAQFKATWYYQWRVRAAHKNGLVSAWSASAEKLMAEDTTGPDQPTVTVVSLPLGNFVTISTPAISGGACPDFAYFKIEGSSNAGGAWSTLAAQHKSVIFIHDLTNTLITQAWRYRVTAYDTSGNASTVSAATSDYSPTKVDGGAAIIAESIVAGSIAAGAITAVKVTAGTFTGVEFSASVAIVCGTGDDVAGFTGADSTYRLYVGDATPADAPFRVTKAGAVTMTTATIDGTAANLTCGSSNDVVRLSGDDSTYRIWAGHATAASAPFRVTKAGVLTATSASISTNSGNERIEITTSGGLGVIALYVGSSLSAKMFQIDLGDYNLGAFYCTGTDPLEWGGTYNCSLLGWGLIPSADFCLGLPTGSGKFYDLSVPRIYFNTTSHALKVDYSGSTYTYSPDA